ncbi:hypothetical protein BO83DRAFT_407494 [Aspergillus eucalypticola CBS 122712]|uniref:Uncharacterized protein n=1 Tax=Aspergillus eucalypticola (strain CBS 122712 / IBT 29274) TaxID=1448314 RepID=A0A317VQM4_ASPEC|nr:uncharacterized protein BO83DRAFT_407494 [Aspergillus eucalypticola CBS 122712]PWY75859.1 hypothetical protein BO83DRAFT_407494 [Aspergillus eucalypticola CBS 122712]
MASIGGRIESSQVSDGGKPPLPGQKECKDGAGLTLGLPHQAGLATLGGGGETNNNGLNVVAVEGRLKQVEMSMEEKSWSPSGEEIPPPLGDPNGPHPMSATPWMTETIAQRRVARRILHQSVLYPRTPDRGHGGVDHIGKFEKNDWRGGRKRSCLWSWQTGPHRGAGWNGRNCNPFRTIHLSHDPLELESNPPSFSSPPVGGLPADPQTLKPAPTDWHVKTPTASQPDDPQRKCPTVAKNSPRRKKKGSDHQSVRLISIPSRVGDFPPAADVADWLARLRDGALVSVCSEVFSVLIIPSIH